MAMMAIFSSVSYTRALPFGFVLKFLITQGYSDMTKKLTRLLHYPMYAVCQGDTPTIRWDASRLSMKRQKSCHSSRGWLLLWE